MRLERLDILNATLALVAVINPLGNLPVFVELTSDLNKNTHRRFLNPAVTTGYVTLTVLTFMSGRHEVTKLWK